MKKVLVTGGAGMLGPVVARTFVQSDYDVITLDKITIGSPPCDSSHISFDLSQENFDALGELIKPDVIVHCAAITNHRTCNDYPDLTYRVNVMSAAKLAQIYPDARIIYISSDAVYAPSVSIARESSALTSGGTYALSKLQGEVELLKVSKLATCIRTTPVGFAPTRGEKEHFLDWMVGSLRERQDITLYADAIFTPIDTCSLAQVLVDLVDIPCPSVLNVASDSSISKYDFGVRVALALGLDTATITKGFLPETFNSLENRANQSLSIDLFKQYAAMSAPSTSQIIKNLANQWRTHGQHN
ncbi:MAG: sugar nucleotide-binding protein [Coriobacteriia bacterium]|nr:sugar nucleotide-binding protein [Coriobacteriia bacterium]